MDKIYNQKYIQAKRGLWQRTRERFLFPKVLNLVKPEQEDRILEIGCEKGDLIKMLSSYSRKVIGIDINQQLINKLNKNNLLYMSAEKLDFPASSFTKVISCHTIEHLANLKKIFSEIERVLQPHGKCILIYPYELIRGFAALRDAWRGFKNPFLARKIHLHRLWPNKLKKFTSMKIIQKGFFLEPSLTLSFYTILEKVN